MRVSNYKIFLFLLLTLALLFTPAQAEEIEFSSDDLELSADELVIDDLNKLIIASGNVRLTQRDLELKAEKIEGDEQLEEILATGSVKLSRANELLQGERLELNLSLNKGYLSENASYKSNGMLIKGAEFEFDYNEEFLSVTGGVEIEDKEEDLFAVANRLEYKQAQGEIVLYDDVEVIRGDRKMSAQEIIIDTETRKLTARGQTRLIGK